MISLRQLNYALAVEKHLHFRKAAEECSVSQSALSTALSELEKQLGFLIFERDNKKVLITPVGQKILDKASEIMLHLDDLYKLSDTQKTPLSHSISIGIIPTIAPYLLPIVLPALTQKYVDLQLNIIEEQSHVLVEKVRKGEIDTAILALPYTCDGLLTFEFWQEDFFWITHHDDAFAEREEIAADELEQSKLMLLKEGHCLKDQALSACQFSSNAQHGLSATSLNTLTQLVAGKFGTTLIPHMALDQLTARNPLLRSVHLGEPGPHRRIAFVVRPGYPSLDNIDLLMALFADTLNQHYESAL